MYYVDKKYLLLASTYLANFKDTGNDVYRFRCPLCGDSKKNKHRTRGYIYPVKDSCAFKCHNCGASLGLSKFIKELSSDLYQQYIFERFIAPKKRVENPVASTAHFSNLQTVDKVLMVCDAVVDLEESHLAKTYLNGRLIPTPMQERLYYTDSVRRLAHSIPKYVGRNFKDDPAIVIPYFSDDNQLTYLKCRVLTDDPDAMRYVNLEIVPGKHVWGIHDIDPNKTVYVLEGEFDAMLVDNAIAVGSASVMMTLVKYLREQCKAGFTFVFDKDYDSNMEVYKQFRDAIESQVAVVFFDSRFPGKDINKAVQNGLTDVTTYLKEHTKVGLYAKLELTKLKITKVFDDQQKEKRAKARRVFSIR